MTQRESEQTSNWPCCCTVPLSVLAWSCPAGGDAGFTSSVDCGGGGGGGGAAATGCSGWDTYAAVSELDAMDVIPITSRWAIHCFANDAQSTTASNRHVHYSAHTNTVLTSLQRGHSENEIHHWQGVLYYMELNWNTHIRLFISNTSRIICRARMRLFFNCVYTWNNICNCALMHY